jgi:hypothetical protein
MAPQSKGGQKLKKQTNEHYKGSFLNTQKVPFMLFFLLLQFKHDLQHFRWCSYGI